MILDTVRKHLKEYDIKVLKETEYEDLHKLQSSNKEYYSLLQSHEVTMEESINDTIIMPDKVRLDQKFFIAFYKSSHLEAVMDYIEEYPKAGVVWIGLVMLDKKYQKRGLGRIIMSSFMKALKDEGKRSIQLGAIDRNTPAISFWKSLGFYEIRRASRKHEEGYMFEIIVMEKAL